MTRRPGPLWIDELPRARPRATGPAVSSVISSAKHSARSKFPPTTRLVPELRIARTAARIPLQAVSDDPGVRPTTVSRIERGLEYDPSSLSATGPCSPLAPQIAQHWEHQRSGDIDPDCSGQEQSVGGTRDNKSLTTQSRLGMPRARIAAVTRLCASSRAAVREVVPVRSASLSIAAVCSRIRLETDA